jgi:hypothetical protein
VIDFRLVTPLLFDRIDDKSDLFRIGGICYIIGGSRFDGHYSESYFLLGAHDDDFRAGKAIP